MVIVLFSVLQTQIHCVTTSTEDVYVDMKKDHHHFDFSDYPEIHFLHNNLNKKVLGK